ncbi:MAG: NAD-dependent epimerase/dehydratase family protein [Hyphomicrobiaceae bacterium]
MARFNRLLITGAAGNLGRHLRKELAPLATHLRLSDIGDLGEAAPNEEIVQGNVADADLMMALTKDVDMVVHMGGQANEHTWETLLNANIVGLYNTYEGCRKNGVKRIVWPSSNHAIGFYPREQVIDASVYPRPDTNYGVTKVFGEGLAQYYWDKYGLESVSVRIGSCFPKPLDRRMLTTWLSYPDMTHLIERCLIAPRVAHTVIYGVSDNDMKLWDNHMAAHIGFRPKDNAEVYRAEIEAAHPEVAIDDARTARHGGQFAAAPHYED